MTVTNVAGRFGTVILIGFLNLIISIFVVIMWAGYIYPAFVYHICVVSAAEFYFIHAADL